MPRAQDAFAAGVRATRNQAGVHESCVRSLGMREHDLRRLPTPEPETSNGEKCKKRNALTERSEAHRRWIDDDVDLACRGID